MPSQTQRSAMSDDDGHPADQFKFTEPKSRVEHIASWAEHFEAGDTIQWICDEVDEVQESEVVGFSTQGGIATPVIEAPDVLDRGGNFETLRVNEKHWVPKDAKSVAHIEMEYTQRMTVKIPVDEMPPSEEDAFHLVKNADPEFVADVLPNRWDDAVTQGDLQVVGLEEEINGGDGL